MPALHQESGMAIESVLFPDRHAECSFTEEDDRGDGVARIQTVLVDRDICPTEWEAVVSAIAALVDAARVVLRHPPDIIPSRNMS